MSSQGKITAYPLSWPVGYGRTSRDLRQFAKFCTTRKGGAYDHRDRVTIADAVERVRYAVQRTAGADEPVISSNLRTRLDGYPMSGQAEPEDSGVAVYFRIEGNPLVFCCDKWSRAADNMAAIAATLEALRSIDRWGVTEANRAYTGFAALPEKGTARSWWQILQVERTAPAAEIRIAYRKALRATHPDTGGSNDAFHEVQTAWEHAQQERRELEA